MTHPVSSSTGANGSITGRVHYWTTHLRDGRAYGTDYFRLVEFRTYNGTFDYFWNIFNDFKIIYF